MNRQLQGGNRLMRRSVLASLLLLLLLFAAAAFADSISGTVTNATTGKAAAGVTVTLVDPMGGMAEIGTTKADAQGHFQLEAAAAQGPRLVRAEKGGVNYFKMITPGSASIDLDVYESAPSLDGISGSADVVKMQTQGSTLQVIELFAVKNASSPPRALASAATFEFVLPAGAEIVGADAQGPNGQPISATPNPTKEKNHYAFSYALKPGETRFQVSYHLPYSGMASFSPRLTRPFDHYVLVMPTTMSFNPKDAKQFQAMTNQPGSTVEVSVHARAGQDLGYSVSGTGTVQDDQSAQVPQNGDGGQAMGGGGAMGGGAGGDSRPGGGLGKPIDAPDGLAKYRWYILGVLLTVLVGGGIWTHERNKQAESENEPVPRPSSAAALQPTPRRASPAQPSYAAPPAYAGQPPAYTAAQPMPAPSNLLLTALKEELFELEVERQQGKLSPEEYGKARAALEQTLQRALARTRS
jgi:hypothetical protein